MDKKSGLTPIVIGFIVVGLVAILYWSMSVHYRNREIALRNLYRTHIASLKVDHDAMWKIISENFHVAETERKTFAEAYEKIVKTDPKSQSDVQAVPGLLMAIGVRPPQVDSSLYRQVQNAISAQRTKFATAQQDSLDVWNEHKTLITTWPGNMFIGGAAAQELEMVTITSTKTEKVFESGKDDETIGGKR